MSLDAQQIPHLLALLDDRDQEVKDQVFNDLSSFGHNLEHLLTPYLEEIPHDKAKLLRRWVADIRIARFRAHWLDWLEEKEDPVALEQAMSWLAYLQADWAPEPLGDLLDQLARRCREKYPQPQVDDLMRFLFVEEGFLPPAKNYYHPRNSNLITVVHRRRGLQISLACLAILVGYRLELAVAGFNMPGHFMVMSHGYGTVVLYDVFNQGQPLPAQTHAFLEQSLTMQEVSLNDLQAQTHQIVPRVLRNLINAYQRRDELEQARFFQQLLDELMEELKKRGMA
jgi:regulator of sirC expression with transglutaminase-like and TPR domain